MKKAVLIFSTFVVLPMIGFPMGKPPMGVSLLLVPARPAMVQLGKDMAERGHTLLMTYAEKTSPEDPFIHLWDGGRWLRVSPEKFARGDFIRNRAANVLVVGDENELTARLIEQGLSWSPEVLHLGSLTVTELINHMGKLYEFNRREWEWFAKRYDLSLEDAGVGGKPKSWYDSNRASTLPPAERPWQKHTATPPQAPQTSLTPVMPPSAGLESDESVEEPDDFPGESPSPSSGNAEGPADPPVSLELEP